jgi:hypothetical protein
MTQEEQDWLKDLLDIEEGLRSRDCDWIEALSHRNKNRKLLPHEHERLAALHEQHCG